MLELMVNLRYAVSRIGLQVARLNSAYQRTRDPRIAELMYKLLRLQAALEVLTVKLETILHVGILSSEALSTIREVVSMLRGEYGDVAPGLASMLADLENSVTAIASLTGVELPAYTHQDTSLSDEARRILEEANIIAQQRMEELRVREGT